MKRAIQDIYFEETVNSVTLEMKGIHMCSPLLDHSNTTV